MSKFILFSRFNKKHIRPQMNGKQKKFSVNANMLRLMIVSTVLALGIFYLVETNQVSTRGFELRNLQDKVDELNVQNEKLEVEAAEMKSMQRIEELSQELNLISGGPVLYLNTASAEVAAK
ncbi:MAG: hypothetical protein ABIB97_02985 [Patescibacteria group bacterium]